MAHNKMARACALILLLSSASASPLTSMFRENVAPVDPVASPNRFQHSAHLRTPMGRFTHFEYDARKHPRTIHPHAQPNQRVTACTQHTVTLTLSGEDNVELARQWGAGWLFTMTPDHVPDGCPDARTGRVERRAPHYRNVTAVVSLTVGTSADGATPTATITLRTAPASFHDMFESLDMTMHSTQMLHEDPSLVQFRGERRRMAAEMETDGDAAPAKRSLLSARAALSEDAPRRRLHFGKFFKKAAKWVKKRVLRPAKEAVKLLVTGKAANTWTKDFSLNWNYDKETGSALKSLPIHGQTACSSCFFHADAGYKVAITIEHYHLNTVLAEVYGDVQLELAMTNPGVAADVHKLDKVMDAELFSVSFMLGPIPITVSLDLEVDLGLRFTVKEVGQTPHIHAQGNGHIRFGKQYDRSNGLGWQPVNSHTLDLSFDSSGGTAHADLYLYANIVPTLHLHHVGSAMVTITPAVDVGLTAALPQASCDYQPLVDKDHAVCEESEGTDNDGCALGMTVTPSINVEMNLLLDIELWKKTIYKKTFDPMPLFQKTFDIHGFPKCLVASWDKKQNGGRRVMMLEAGPAVSASTPALAVVRRKGGRDLSATTGRALSAAALVNLTGTIRDPDLASPRKYLERRGRDTPCPSDCSGNGFCVRHNDSLPEIEANMACVCQRGWTGDDCTTPALVVDRAQIEGGGTPAGGDHPKPATCGHGVGVSAESEVASASLRVCKGRTAPLFCASGNATEMREVDAAIEGVLKGYTESGYPCAAAMAELQCRMSFPAVKKGDGKSTLLPVTFRSCAALFLPCLGEDTANDICSDAAGDGIAQSWAGVAAIDSPWDTTTLPSLFTAEAEANREHRKCVLAKAGSGLSGCPSREGKMVHVNTDVWSTVAEIDRYVVNAVRDVADGRRAGEDDDLPASASCAEATRSRLCASNMPLCNEFGNPIKLRYDECVSMVASCPAIAEKDESMYGLPSAGSGANAEARFAAAVCSDNSAFFHP
jgi:hypothetical protein